MIKIKVDTSRFQRQIDKLKVDEDLRKALAESVSWAVRAASILPAPFTAASFDMKPSIPFGSGEFASIEIKRIAHRERRLAQIQAMTGMPASQSKNELAKYPGSIDDFYYEIMTGGEWYERLARLTKMYQENAIEIDDVNFTVGKFDIELEK